MKLFLKILVLTAALVAILKSCTPFLDTHNPLIGQQVPDFTLETLSGQKVNMTQFRNGQPALIFFWATWCPHCRIQLKELTKERQKIEKSGIKIILVDVGESVQHVQSYVEANNISFNVFLDQSTQLAQEYQVVGIPTFFFINKEGIVADVSNALTDHHQETLLGLAL